MKKVILGLFILIGFASCTSNQRARSFGGTETITLLPNEKFVNITWKDADLWVITEDTIADCYYAREKSSYGLMEGKIVIYKNK